MSFKDLMTYKHILIRHIYTSVISWCPMTNRSPHGIITIWIIPNMRLCSALRVARASSEHVNATDHTAGVNDTSAATRWYIRTMSIVTASALCADLGNCAQGGAGTWAFCLSTVMSKKSCKAKNWSRFNRLAAAAEPSRVRAGGVLWSG